MPRASTLGTEWSSWAATGLLAAGAAALAWRSQARDDSSTTMYGGHDKRTFRGKLHAHTFGKFRLRKGKKRRIKAIKNGTFDASKVVQRGQPEPEHPWDFDNLVENPNPELCVEGFFLGGAGSVICFCWATGVIPRVGPGCTGWSECFVYS